MHRFLIMLVLALQAGSAVAEGSLKTVDRVDLQRYAGKWYEIARVPNRFQKKCDRDVAAVYTVEGDRVGVTNTCVEKDGRVKSVTGKARVTDSSTGAKLKVTFFWPFSGDYWVIGLDKDYRWAVVGEPKRRYLWVLSRTPVLGRETVDRILRVVTEKGYEASALVFTRQSPAGN